MLPRKCLENTYSETNMVLESDELTCVHFSVTLQENLVQSCCLGCKHTDKSAFSLRHLSICWVIITNVGLMWRLSRLVRFIIGNSVALPLAPTLSFHRPHYSVNTCMCLKCEHEASCTLSMQVLSTLIKSSHLKWEGIGEKLCTSLELCVLDFVELNLSWGRGGEGGGGKSPSLQALIEL